MNPMLLSQMLELSLSSGRCIKFDLKAYNDDLHQALTGVSNRRTLANFAHAGARAELRKDPPLVVASTPLVPGYIDPQEIRSLAGFVASISPEIPYSLLAYYPQFYMADLPVVPRSLAESCLEAAMEEGLQRVRLGNTQLLGRGIEAFWPGGAGESKGAEQRQYMILEIFNGAMSSDGKQEKE